jgi:hypothetical protein
LAAVSADLGIVRDRTYVRLRSTMPAQGTTRPEVTLSVPADQVEAIRTSVLELYQVCADALRYDTERHLRAGESLETVLRRRAELSALDALLEQVGWPGQPVARRAVSLAGAQPRVREVVYVALARAATDLEAACRGYWQGTNELDELTAHLEDVRARLGLLQRVETSG